MLLGGAEPGPVLRERRGGGEHLRCGARRVRGAITEPVGDGGGGRRKPRGFGGPVAFLYICGRRVVDYGQAARPDHRGVLNPGDHRHPMQNGR